MKAAALLRAYEFGWANGFNKLNSPNPYSGKNESKLHRAWGVGQREGHVKRKAVDALCALMTQPEHVNERQRTFEW